MGETKPEIRILHHLSRVGGTVICKCLGAMQGVVQLSEVHPLGKVYSPVVQARDWYGLLAPGECAPDEMQGEDHFLDAITLILERAAKKGATLLLRDWNHLDYFAVPFLPELSYRLVTADVLSRRFRVINTASVRHPVYQYLSLSKLEIVQKNFTLSQFMAGTRRFAETAQNIQFIRYEDFTSEPDETLQTLCKRLEIPFDAGYAGRWATNRHITGDKSSTDDPRKQIEPFTFREVDPGLLDRCEELDDYWKTLELLGYKHLR